MLVVTDQKYNIESTTMWKLRKFILKPAINLHFWRVQWVHISNVFTSTVSRHSANLPRIIADLNPSVDPPTQSNMAVRSRHVGEMAAENWSECRAPVNNHRDLFADVIRTRLSVAGRHISRVGGLVGPGRSVGVVADLADIACRPAAYIELTLRFTTAQQVPMPSTDWLVFKLAAKMFCYPLAF